MKQGNFRGFEHRAMKSAVAPIRAGDDVVAMCKSQAEAVTHSLNFARKRFGFGHQDIARMCGLHKGNMTDAKKGRRNIPEDRIERFQLACGCTLLEQVIAKLENDKRRNGQESANDRERAVLAMMMRAAA